MPIPEPRLDLAALDAPHPKPESTREERPWGEFEQLTTNSRSTVKVITVCPGARLSLQRHAHRDEHWVILDDGIEVEIGGAPARTRVGEQLWIPRGTTHRMSNVASTPARVLEISYGAFDENDIERLADDYDR